MKCSPLQFLIGDTATNFDAVNHNSGLLYSKGYLIDTL